MHIPLLLPNYLNNKALSKITNQGVDFSEGPEFVLIVARLIIVEVTLFVYPATRSHNRLVPLGVPYRILSQEMLPFTAPSVSFSSLNSSSLSFFTQSPTWHDIDEMHLNFSSEKGPNFADIRDGVLNYFDAREPKVD
jgi:hypothetical protein